MNDASHVRDEIAAARVLGRLLATLRQHDEQEADMVGEAIDTLMHMDSNAMLVQETVKQEIENERLRQGARNLLAAIESAHAQGALSRAAMLRLNTPGALMRRALEAPSIAEVDSMINDNERMREVMSEMVDAFAIEVAADDPLIAKARALLGESPA